MGGIWKMKLLKLCTTPSMIDKMLLVFSQILEKLPLDQLFLWGSKIIEPTRFKSFLFVKRTMIQLMFREYVALCFFFLNANGWILELWRETIKCKNNIFTCIVKQHNCYKFIVTFLSLACVFQNRMKIAFERRQNFIDVIVMILPVTTILSYFFVCRNSTKACKISRGR